MTIPAVSLGKIHVVGRDKSLCSEVGDIVSNEFDDEIDVVPHASLTQYLDEYIDDECACVLIDLDPSVDALAAMTALTLAQVDAPAIVVTRDSNVDASVNALKAGAVDYLVKPTEARRLSRAIRRAFDLNVKRRSDRTRSAGMRAIYRSLTRKERTIVRLIVEGKVNRQIAAELYCCERTAKARRSEVMRKLGCRTVAEVVHIWRLLLPFAGVSDGLRIRTPAALPLFALKATSGNQQPFRVGSTHLQRFE